MIIWYGLAALLSCALALWVSDGSFFDLWFLASYVAAVVFFILLLRRL